MSGAVSELRGNQDCSDSWHAVHVEAIAAAPSVGPTPSDASLFGELYSSCVSLTAQSSDSIVAFVNSTVERSQEFLARPDVHYWIRRWVQRPFVIVMCGAAVESVGRTIFHFADGGRLADAELGGIHWDLVLDWEVCQWLLLVRCVKDGILLAIALLCGGWFFWNIHSPKLRRHADLMFLMWVHVQINFYLSSWSIIGDLRQHSYRNLIVQDVCLSVVDFTYCFLVTRRSLQNVGRLEQGMLRDVGTRCFQRVFYFVFLPSLVPWVASHAVSRLQKFGPQETPSWVLFVRNASWWTIILSWLVGSIILARATLVVWRLVRQVAKLEGTPESHRAKSTCFALMLVSGTSLLSTIAGAFTRHFHFGTWPFDGNNELQAYMMLSNVPVDFVDTLSNIGLSIVSSGVATGAMRYCQSVDNCERERMTKRKESMMKFEASPSTSWQDKVDELADRGLTLKALLDFYRGLGHDYMLNYQPAKHRTVDVVRAAIIPLSKERQCAYAKVMMQGVQTRPQVMVTHAWLNLFVDLVAAIVADALGDESFEFSVTMLLGGRIDELERALAKCNSLTRTYWVCAFSVNQHASICGRCRDADPVTKLVHPACDCGHLAAWASTPPLCPDGRSIPCEMNKFDDMMRLLAADDKHFRQLVAMDRRCMTLRRCWCVAEVVEARYSNMRQLIKVLSPAVLEEHVGSLGELRVEDMQASHPEDIALILSKIPDKEAFNKTYRSIVGEAISDWMRLPDTDRLTRSGRFWFHAASKHATLI